MALWPIFLNICYFIAEKEIKTAVKEGNLDILKILLNNRQDKNPVVWVGNSTGSEYTVLHYAAYLGKLDIFKNISNTLNNMQPKIINGWGKGATPLHLAAQEGHLPIVTYITNCLDKINPAADNGQTPMQWAAKKGKVEIIKFFNEVGIFKLLHPS